MCSCVYLLSLLRGARKELGVHKGTNNAFSGVVYTCLFRRTHLQDIFLLLFYCIAFMSLIGYFLRNQQPQKSRICVCFEAINTIEDDILDTEIAGIEDEDFLQYFSVCCPSSYIHHSIFCIRHPKVRQNPCHLLSVIDEEATEDAV